MTYPQFLNLYGQLLDELEPLVIAVAKSGVQLGSGRLDDIATEVGKEFADKVAGFRQQVEAEVQKIHRGAFDGYVKRLVAETYGPGSDIAKQYGDQEENALCLILPGQAKKVSAIKLLAMFVGVPTPPATKAAVAKLLEAARIKIDADTASSQATRPTRADGEKQSDFLKRLAAFNAAGKSPEAKEVKGAISWLTNWVEGRKPTARTSETMDIAEPPTPKLHELNELIKKLKEEETAVRGTISPAMAVSELARVTTRVTQIAERIAAAKAELKTIEAATAESNRLKAAAAIVASAPPRPGEATRTMPGGVHTPPAQTAEKTPETLEEVVAKIARLEKEYAATMSASERYYAEAQVLCAEADGLRESNRTQAAKKDLAANQLKQKGMRAQEAADKITTRLEHLTARKTELEKAATPQPEQPATPPKKVSMRKPPATPTPAEPAVAAPAVTPHDAKPAATAQSAVAHKIALIKAVKAAKEDLGEVTVTNFLNRISAGEDITAIQAEFEAMTD